MNSSNFIMKIVALLGLLLLAMFAENAAHAQDDAVLARTSKNVTAYLSELSDVKCTERVMQEKLAPNGKVELKQESTFDYLIMMDGNRDELSLNESRLPLKPEAKPTNLPLLVTNGFSTLFLVFHPYYRDGFEFTIDGEEVLEAQRFTRIRFQHIPGRRTPIALSVRGREYPLDISGIAWVEPKTGSIVQLEVQLSKPMDDIGLRLMRVHVDYKPMWLSGASQTYRYPTFASIEVETRKQHWRDEHRFSEYKKFSVSTEVAVAGDKKQ